MSATRFAALTGVSRERLRTWERRHGFPVPRRAARGPRRYAVGDVQRVVAVRHAVAEGVPIPEAIARARAGGASAPVADGALAAVVEHLPTPVVVLSGPAPMRVSYVNGAVRALPGAPAPGAELTGAVPGFGGSVAERALQRLFATEAGPTEAHHPAWGGHARHSSRSTLFRLPAAPGAPPLVAMVGLEGEGERAARAALAAQRLEVDELRRLRARHTGWLDGLAQIGGAIARDPEPGAAIAAGLDAVVRQTGARDAALAAHTDGRLVLAGSRRGLVGHTALVVAAHPSVGRALRDGEPTWLEPSAAAALDVPAELRACAVPLVVAGETLGALVLILAASEGLDAEDRRLLRVLSAAIGFAVLRDRLVEELRRAPARDAGPEL